MAGEDNLLSKLAALVAGFDDSSWEALGSKGLLRRARKDLEKGLQIRIIENVDEVLRIEVPPFLVTMPATGPAGAGCSCPAPGVCHHILAAGLFLQRYSPAVSEPTPGPTRESIHDEISLLTPERIKS